MEQWPKFNFSCPTPFPTDPLKFVKYLISIPFSIPTLSFVLSKYFRAYQFWLKSLRSFQNLFLTHLQTTYILSTNYFKQGVEFMSSGNSCFEISQWLFPQGMWLFFFLLITVFFSRLDLSKSTSHHLSVPLVRKETWELFGLASSQVLLS